jgi:hypothetical protein
MRLLSNWMAFMSGFSSTDVGKTPGQRKRLQCRDEPTHRVDETFRRDGECG